MSYAQTPSQDQPTSTTKTKTKKPKKEKKPKKQPKKDGSVSAGLKERHLRRF
jgi:hypothetical protein